MSRRNVAPVPRAIRGQAAAVYALAALMRWPELLASSGLVPEDFPAERDQALMRAIATVPAEVRTTEGHLPLLEVAARASLPVEQLRDLASCTVYTREQAEHWLREVRQGAALEAIRQELRELAAADPDPEYPVDAVLTRLAEVRDRYLSALAADELTTLEDLATLHVADEERAIESGRPRVLCQSGFHTLDRRCQWGMPGELTVIFGDSGAGKSTFALHLLRRNSARGIGQHGLFFSCEMTAGQLGAKSIFAAGRRDPKDGPILAALDLHDALERLIDSEEGRRIHVDTSPRRTPAQMLATIRRVAGSCGGPLTLAVFDHLRNVDVNALLRKSDGEVQRLSRAAEEAKAVAKASGLHLVMITHTNQTSAEGTAPTRRMLRGSGEIFENADNVLVPWRQPGQPFELHVLKARLTGFLGKAVLTFDQKAQTYREVPS